MSQIPRVTFNAVAVGSSAGGVTALMSLVAVFPKEFAAAILIVQHLDPHHKSLLSELLGRRSVLRVKEAENGEPILPGTIYVAPPDHHMLVAGRSVSLTSSELVHFTRPSIDLLFESVAAAYGPLAIGVVLTGSGYDGRTGLEAIKEQRGRTIVQDPRSAEHSGMPSNALASGCADFTLPLEQIGPAIVSLVDRGVDASVESR